MREYTAVAVVEVGSLGAAYALINGMDLFPETNPLEVIPLATGAACVLEGNPDTLRSLVREQRSADLVAVSVIDDCPPCVLAAFYSLDAASLNGSLVVIEHESLGKIFEVAKAAHGVGFALVEIKPARAGQHRAALLLTRHLGVEQITSEQDSWLRRMKGQTGCGIERLDRISSVLGKFFESIE